MKHIFCVSFLLSLCTSVLFSQSTDKNYSAVIIPKVETAIQNLTNESIDLKQQSVVNVPVGVIQSQSFVATSSIKVSNQTTLKSGTSLKIASQASFNTKYAQEVTYFDGFGREIQKIAVGQTPDGKDIIKHYETDEFGRTVKNYLPVPVNQNNGNFVSNALSQISTYYQANFGDYTPFKEIKHEGTLLDRIVESSEVGDDWKILPNNTGHTTKLEYSFNTDQDKIRYYKFDSSNQLYYVSYSKNYLEKQIIKNENWKLSDGSLNTKEVYKDVKGNVVSEIEYVQSGNQLQKLITGYAYDDLGRLICIVSPLASTKTEPVIDRNLVLGDFLPSGVPGGGSGNVQQIVDNISINFSASFSTSNLKTGPLFYVHNQLPDMSLGHVVPVEGGTYNQNSGIPQPPLENNYIAYIKDGYFCLRSSDDYNPSPYVSNISFSYSIPFPKVMVTNPEILNELTTQYKYDEYNRKIAEKNPGKGWEYVVYDRSDRPILVQDESLRKESPNLWILTKYDNFGREAYKGKYLYNVTNPSRESLQEYITATHDLGKRSEVRTTTVSTIAGTTINYTNNVSPTNIQEILSVTYYDDYDFTDSNKPTTPTTVEGQSVTAKLKGLVTSTWAKTLGGNSWTKRYLYYDKKGRVIRTYQKNFLDGYTQTDSQLDFAGVVLKTTTKHKRLSTSSEVVIKDNYTYDNSKRTIKQTQTINNQEEQRIFSNTFNDFGVVKQKEVGGKASATALQTINYKNNIRGWLTELNNVSNLGNNLFAYKLNYHENFEGEYNQPEVKYDGNIGQIIWKNKYNNTKKSYTYNYDELNRLKSAEYANGESLNEFTASSYSEYVSAYDVNGNILSLSRMGISPYNGYSTQIDGLTYRYNQGNKLLEVTDSGLKEKGFIDNYTTGTDDYEYDASGNLIKDTNKGITSITYNYLDLVQLVTFSDGKTITFVYDAAGNKLSKIYNNAGQITTTEYLGAFQYQQQQLQFVATPEGYAYYNASNNTFNYVYNYTDHLGNVRLSYADADNNGVVSTSEILSSTDYYPMGMMAVDYNSSVASMYRYKFQGKEHQNENNIDLYDFGSRMYDASLGRWFCPDPQNQYYSPYLAMGNNFVGSVDPDGEWVHLVVGAAIGGFVNWAANGAQFNAKGLASFGVGALAGAVSAGIGAGVSSAMVTGGTFGAGFIGSSAAMTATTSFVSGAAIGGATGFSAGFITGIGNGLIAGQNFGQAFWSGTKDGLIGGVTGGVLGGALGGIDAAMDNRNFWHGGRLTSDVSLPINQVNQINSDIPDGENWDCNFACGESIDEYYGNNRKVVDFKNFADGKSNGLRTPEITKMYGKAGYKIEGINTGNVDQISGSMMQGKPVVVNHRTGSTIVNGKTVRTAHATVVQRVRQYDNGKFVIKVMNPAGGKTKYTSVKNFYEVFSVLKF